MPTQKPNDKVGIKTENVGYGGSSRMRNIEGRNKESSIE